MLERFWDGTVKLLFIKNAMDAIPTFRPLAKEPADVETMIDLREPARATYVAMHTALEEGQVEVREAYTTARQEAVRAYALMKSNYVENRKRMELIVRIPKAMASPKTLVLRMEKTSSVWSKLPNPPGSATPFTSNGLTKAQFDALKETLLTKFSTCTMCKTDFEEAKGELDEVAREQRTFIVRALAQGRAQFLPGTPERAIIDGIPTEPSAQPPGEVAWDTAESGAAGEVYLKFAAEHATAFRIEHKGPGDAAFATVATVPRIEGIGQYAVDELPGGVHEYRVFGANSRGEGPVSTVQSIEVAAEEAA